ncbi:MAG: class I SAM-dependent methyltransferase, partial [Actinomycetes bacterium]
MEPPSDADDPAGTSQYFSATPETGHRPGKVTLADRSATFALATDSGVFAADHVDLGTRVLLDELPDLSHLPDGDIVDVGCGYGPIAIAVAARHPERHVLAVDVNERALELCRRNARQASVEVS